MYVRLKHALSALALDALAAPPRGAARAAVAWLAAYCGLVADPAAAPGAGAGCFEVPVDEVARRLRRSRAGTGGADELTTRGLLERRDGRLVLPEAYRAHFPYAHRQVHRLAAVLRGRGASRGRGRAEAVRRGAALFNGGLFFECHEYFEGLWRAAPAAEKPLFHGVIQVAAAFYHLEKGNLHGARSKLASGIGKLLTRPRVSHGVRIGRWLAALAPWQAEIDAGRRAGPLRVADVPRIPLDRSRRP